jgi:hypothetical protein
VDVAAPGVDIYVTMPTYHVEFNGLLGLSQNFDYVSGTSFSCPLVSGIAGLLLSKNPQLTPYQIKAIICDNVDPYISDVYIGTGRANAHKALQSCNPPHTPSIRGETSGKSGEEHEYTFSALDPDGHNVTYCIDWGDHTEEVCIGPFPSGEEATAIHSWDKDGTYIIRVKSKDIYELESEWATLEVSMPKNKENSPVGGPWFIRGTFKYLDEDEDYIYVRAFHATIWGIGVRYRLLLPQIKLSKPFYGFLYKGFLPLPGIGICREWDYVET